MNRYCVCPASDTLAFVRKKQVRSMTSSRHKCLSVQEDFHFGGKMHQEKGFYLHATPHHHCLSPEKTEENKKGINNIDHFIKEEIDAGFVCLFVPKFM